LAWGAVSKPTAKSVVAEVSSVLSFIAVLHWLMAGSGEC
jgi:hypothetical protein